MRSPLLLLSAFILYVAAQQAPEMLSGYAGERAHLVGFQFAQLVTGFGAVVAAGYVLSRHSPFPIIAAGLASAILAALLAFLTVDHPASGPPIAGLVVQSNPFERAIGSFFNPNYFGLFEAIAIVIAIGLLPTARSRLIRWILLVIAIVLGAAVALSFSRGALVALAAGLVCLGIARGRARIALLLGGSVLVAMVIVYPIFVQWRVDETFGEASRDTYAALAASDAGRLRGVLAGPTLFLSSPLFGVGWGHYSFLAAEMAGLPNRIAAHNWYMNTLAEQGLVGIVLWTLLLASLVVGLRSRSLPARTVGVAVLGTYVVGSVFLEPPASFQTSALAIIAIVAALVSDWTAPGKPDSELPTPTESEGHQRGLQVLPTRRGSLARSSRRSA